MVDFNNEAILSTDKYAYNNLLSVEKRQGVIDALGKYERLKFQGSNAPNNVVKATILELYRQVRTNLKKTDSSSEKMIKELLSTKDFDKILEAFELIDDWLFEAGTTQFVRIKDYELEDAEEENIAFGL